MFRRQAGNAFNFFAHIFSKAVTLSRLQTARVIITQLLGYLDEEGCQNIVLTGFAHHI